MKPLRILVGAAALALVAPLSAHASPATGSPRFEATPTRGVVDAKVLPTSVDDTSQVKVIVELSDDPVAVVQANTDRRLSAPEKENVRAKVREQQAPVVSAAKSKGAKVVSQMQDAYNGVHLSIQRNHVSSLADLPNVVAVHSVTRFTPDNAVSVPYLGAPQVWQSTGFTGKGVKVGIIDTGIDYTHADFGGPGTTAAYDAAHAQEAAPANPALFGPTAPRVKGGWDFVGDAYDAEKNPVPAPDANPLDCATAGHGTHVAGTTAGGGVTAAGAAYTGPYNAATASLSWKVGPGVAPQADLYAYRVFGCHGSTDVTTEAIDRAVKDGMNVINMSLGSPFGRADDPSSVAASNAVGAGVVVVASAGNSGQNPYITGAPGAGRGVVSVAANDSTAQFPGAVMSFGSTQMDAINANGFTPLPAGPLTIVVVPNDPATPENESLGCSAEAFTKAGIHAGGNQAAVVNRGTCARAAKAVYGAEAGAAAVIQINSSASYPPFEGTITSNPDTGAPATVAIPFLGVRSTDGAALRAANGQSLTLAPKPLDNPAFTAPADFTSGGPRNGDSGLKPSVTAPGVSIRSAGVATGSGDEVMSGTSMAAPHVAGVASLGVQAHPTWSAQDISAVIVTTADPEKVKGYTLPVAGNGVVDAAQVVATSTVILGDSFRTTSGRLREPTLSFGFAESALFALDTKRLTIVNKSDRPVTYTLAAEPSKQSKPATVTLSRTSVKVPARGSAEVLVTVSVQMSKVGSSLTGGFGFAEVSGSIKVSAAGENLRIPYLMVPRADSNVRALGLGFGNSGGNAPLTLLNIGGALTGGTDFYQWGLTDGRDVDYKKNAGAGYDLRAVGVQSFDDGADKQIVFAINNWDRFSNAATNDYEIAIDVNGDGKPDKVVFAMDFGAITTGDYNGKSATFIYDVATKAVSASAYTMAPTDSSTLLLPVYASDLGVTGAFTYSVTAYSVEGAGTDTIEGSATYDPWHKVFSLDATWADVATKAPTKLNGTIDAAQKAAQKPLGLMAVVFDNAAGDSEALLVPVR